MRVGVVGGADRARQGLGPGVRPGGGRVLGGWGLEGRCALRIIYRVLYRTLYQLQAENRNKCKNHRQGSVSNKHLNDDRADEG